MSAREFDSIISSPLGAAVKSPLNVRETGGSIRAVYIIATSITPDPDTGLPATNEVLHRLSLENLRTSILGVRPPWWPSSWPGLGHIWHGNGISGDADTVWYSAYNQVAFRGSDPSRTGQADERWSIDIYRLDGNLQEVNKWRWSQPALGGGRAWHITPFGDSTALWGIVRVHESPQPWRYTTAFPGETYLVELNPETMEIRRASPDLWAGLSDLERTRRTYAPSGGGNSSTIWVARSLVAPNNARFRYQILEYDPDDFSLVRATTIPRGDSDTHVTNFRRLTGIGGDSDSIWIITNPFRTFDTFASELPRDFADNRTILQDEVRPPTVAGEFPLTWDIG